MTSRYPTYDEDDWVKPVPRIRGMQVAHGESSNHAQFKPYRYNGTGEDQFPETRAMPEPPKPPAVTAEQYREREVARMKREANKARRAKVRQEVRQRRNLRIETVRTILDPPVAQHPLPLPEVGEDEPLVVICGHAADPMNKRHRHYRRKPPVASPGWRPMTGADIEELLDAL